MSPGQDRLFKVTITHDGKVVSAVEVTAQLPAEAVDRVWAEYEAVNGLVNAFDTSYVTTVEPIAPPPRRKRPEGG